MNYTELSDKVIELSHLSHKEILDYVESQGNDEFLVDLKMIIDICEKDSDYSIKDFLELQRKFKRIAILDILSTTVKDRKLFEEIRDTIMGNKLSKLDHIKNVVKNLRDYVGVSDCAVKEFGEVMTPIELVEEMLDTLPAEVWSNPNLKWLDPANGVGIFPCVVVYRLMEGLKEFEPDEDLRYKHIMENMLYVCELQTKNMFIYQTGFDPYDEIELNIHNGSFLDKVFEEKMKIWGVEKFDIVVGNPPYQTGDGSGISTDAAIPIYNKFIEKIKKMKPQYLSFIIPSKWMVGGRGLKKFREDMMEDRRIRMLYDFENAFDVFPGVHIDGGVCYFMWDIDYDGKIDYTFKSNKGIINTSKTYLKNQYFEYVIRDNRILSILDKVSKGSRFSEIVSETKPFGIRKYLFNEPDRYPDSNLQLTYFENSVKIYGVKGIKGGAKRIIGYINRDSITKNQALIDKYKLFFTTSYSTNAVNPPETIKGLPNEVCTETFLMVGHFDTEKEQHNCYKYMNTKFFKTLLYFGKGTMQVTKRVFGLIPLVDFKENWIDEKLYEKYEFVKEEIDFIERMFI